MPLQDFMGCLNFSAEDKIIQAGALYDYRLLLPPFQSLVCSLLNSYILNSCLLTAWQFWSFYSSLFVRLGTSFFLCVIISFDFNDLAQKTLGIGILGIFLPCSSFVFRNFRFHYHCWLSYYHFFINLKEFFLHSQLHLLQWYFYYYFIYTWTWNSIRIGR